MLTTLIKIFIWSVIITASVAFGWLRWGNPGLLCGVPPFALVVVGMIWKWKEGYYEQDLEGSIDE